MAPWTAVAALCLSLGPTGQSQPRAYRMGFSHIPPKMTLEAAVRTLGEWAPHGDGAVDHRDVPWRHLLEGGSPEAYIAKEVRDLMKYYRSKKYALVCMVEPADGLDRWKEAKPLRELGRSLSEPSVQDAYVRYVEALAGEFKPEYLGLASEVNVLLDSLPEPARKGLTGMCRRAADRVRQVSPKTKLYVSVQMDYAWGRLVSSDGFRGAEAVFKSFPFIEAFGASTYPAFGWTTPGEVPDDYFARVLSGHKLPVVVDEGGWPSESAGKVTSSRNAQAAWITRLFHLLDGCDTAFVGQLTYTDLDIPAIPGADQTILPMFSTMGLVDRRWKPKPALSVWTGQFARPLKAGR